ncbi:SMEK domain-containing protein [Microcoleus sp. MOSTC5]|uniref:SMEK domain-containing protein n=1 Tax=Microcoleus sp. MOSTC5 TaxID=3055378 RepID=UPI002FD4E7E5
MNLERSQQRIRVLMSRFVEQVRSATAMQKTDINKLAQTILIPLLAEVYGYQNLKDLDFTEGSNYPSVDLGDETARVAFQITSTRGIEKVKHTLTEFVEHKLYEKYDRIIIYIITDRQKDYSDTEINKIIQGKLSFDVKNDIWDYRDILGEVAKFQIEKAREVEKILEANFGEERKEPDWEVVDKVDQIINESTELFVGGSENFQKLDNFLADNSSGVMLVRAGAGLGKTSLLANWIRERQGNRCFIAYHFFSQQYDKTRYVKSAYWNLLRQIYSYYELYHEQLPNELDELRKRLYNILKERGARQDKPLVIVIDALDEIDAAEMPFSLPFLTPLPQNVFVIVSARAESDEEPKYLENWTEKSQKLHLEYLPREAIADWLRETGDGELAVFAEDTNFVTQLDEITQGFPLYLSYLIDELSHAVKQGIDLHSILARTPKGFSIYVKQQFQQLANVAQIRQHPEVKELFALLSVALGVLSEDDIQELTNLDEWGLAALPWQATRWFSVQKGFYSFAHPLLAQEFQSLLGRQAQQARDKLIEYCARWQERSIPYALRHYAEHLSEAKQWEALYAITRNEDFYSHSIKQFPDEPDLPLKTVQTALLAAAEEDKAGEMAEFMLLHARQLLQTTAQDSPLDALRKGSLERAWRLTDLYEIERRILWYLLLAWELKDTGRFEEAEETLKQLQQQELPRLSTHPDIEWQSEYATYLLAYVFEVSEKICTSLEQKLLDDRYRCILCVNLSERGNFAAALKTLQGVSAQILWQVRTLLNIAKAQVQKGDIEYYATFTNAIDIVKTLVSNSSWEKWVLIGNIAKAQIEVGDRASAQATLTEALETADNKIDNPLHQVNAFVALANVQAEVGMVEEAIATLQKIESKPEVDQLFISINITKVWFKIGNKDKIKPIFTRHLDIANGITDEEKQTDVLQKIVIAQAEVREFEDARENAKKIDFLDRQAYVLMRIAIEQAQVREFTTALETVEEIEIKHYQSEAWLEIATSQAKARNFPGAFVTTSRIEEPLFKEQALREIAIAKAEASPFTDDALEIAEQIESNPEQMEALVGIVRIQGKVKNFPALLKIKDKVGGKEWKEEVLSAIAEAYAKAEDFTTAFEIATEIDIPSMQVKTLGVIAEVQAQVGQTEAARATFANVLKIEKPLEASISFIRLLALARVAEVQVKNAQKEVGVTTASIACEIAQSMNNPMETANILAGILVPILIEAEKIQEAKIICDRAYEIAQQISDNQEYQRSKTFGFVAEAQARLGEFDVALRTLETIRMPYFHVDALRSIVQLQIEAKPQQREKYKIALNDADEYYKNADPIYLIFSNKVQLLTIIAVARSTIGETEAALATFADLLEAAKTKEQRERDKDFSIIAIGYAEIGEFPTAIKIINEIREGAQQLNALGKIAWEQFKKGEQVTTLDIALAAKEKIEDEQKRLEALKIIAQIQAIAGKGEEALRTLAAMLSDRNTHLRDLALLFAETGDRVNFKHLLIPCAYYLDTAYQMCEYLARLYPEQASAVAQVLSELNEGEQ